VRVGPDRILRNVNHGDGALIIIKVQFTWRRTGQHLPEKPFIERLGIMLWCNWVVSSFRLHWRGRGILAGWKALHNMLLKPAVQLFGIQQGEIQSVVLHCAAELGVLGDFQPWKACPVQELLHAVSIKKGFMNE